MRTTVGSDTFSGCDVWNSKPQKGTRNDTDGLLANAFAVTHASTGSEDPECATRWVSRPCVRPRLLGMEDAWHYREEGAGRPLVLLHGIGMSHLAWRPVIPHLRVTRRV